MALASGLHHMCVYLQLGGEHCCDPRRPLQPSVALGPAQAEHQGCHSARDYEPAPRAGPPPPAWRRAPPRTTRGAAGPRACRPGPAGCGPGDRGCPRCRPRPRGRCRSRRSCPVPSPVPCWPSREGRMQASSDHRDLQAWTAAVIRSAFQFHGSSRSSSLALVRPETTRSSTSVSQAKSLPETKLLI